MEICVSFVFWLTSVCLQGPSSQALAMGSGGFLRSVSLLECSSISFFPFLGQFFYVFFLNFLPRNVSDADHLIAGQHGLPAQPLCAVHGLLCTESAPGELSQVFIFVIFIFSPVFICTNTTINFFRQHFFLFIFSLFSQAFILLKEWSFSQVFIRLDNDYFRPGENISSSSHWR